MEWHERQAELEDLADRLGIEVRHVRYEGAGGLCRIRGRRVLMVNDLQEAPERVATLAEGLGSLPEVQELYVVPEVRALLDQYAVESKEDPCS
jgi:hypothetical protein